MLRIRDGEQYLRILREYATTFLFTSAVRSPLQFVPSSLVFEKKQSKQLWQCERAHISWTTLSFPFSVIYAFLSVSCSLFLRFVPLFVVLFQFAVCLHSVNYGFPLLYNSLDHMHAY